MKNYMLSQTSSGEVLNVLSTDLGKLEFVGIFLTFFIVFPIYFVAKVVASYFVSLHTKFKTKELAHILRTSCKMLPKLWPR